MLFRRRMPLHDFSRPYVPILSEWLSLIHIWKFETEVLGVLDRDDPDIAAFPDDGDAHGVSNYFSRFGMGGAVVGDVSVLLRGTTFSVRCSDGVADEESGNDDIDSHGYSRIVLV